jgi:hypothetical protein
MTTRAKKTIVGLSIIIGLCVLITAYIVFRPRSQLLGGHPHPSRSEIYEWRDPNSHDAVIRAVVIKWTGGERTLEKLMFKGIRGTVWYIHFDPLSLADPEKSWLVCRGSPEVEFEVPLTEMQSVGPGVNVGDWSAIDQLDGTSNRSDNNGGPR